MKLPIVLRDEARREFDEAIDWYALKRSGLGLEFLAEVQRTFDLIADGPQRFAPVLSDVRKAVVRRFPYCIFYRPHPNRVEIIAVFHGARNPSAWQRRV